MAIILRLVLRWKRDLLAVDLPLPDLEVRLVLGDAVVLLAVQGVEEMLGWV